LRKQSKKLIAPVFITLLLTAYWITSIVVWLQNPVLITGKIIGILIPLALIGVSVFVLIERIKEIRSGEEDDLSKY
jgi:large-conductance mechanosensitive channel